MFQLAYAHDLSSSSTTTPPQDYEGGKPFEYYWEFASPPRTTRTCCVKRTCRYPREDSYYINLYKTPIQNGYHLQNSNDEDDFCPGLGLDVGCWVDMYPPPPLVPDDIYSHFANLGSDTLFASKRSSSQDDPLTQRGQRVQRDSFRQSQLGDTSAQTDSTRGNEPFAPPKPYLGRFQRTGRP